MDEFWETPIERQANKCAMIEPPPGTDISTIGAHTIRRPIAKANKSNEDPGQISFSHLFIPYAERVSLSDRAQLWGNDLQSNPAQQ